MEQIKLIVKSHGLHSTGLQKRIHPTEKPVQLYKWSLLNYAQPGWKILDTHGGSFSHAIACQDLGFDLEGYEIDTEYYNKAVTRLRLHQAEPLIPYPQKEPISEQTQLFIL